MRDKKFKWMFWVFPMIYTGLVALSRIIYAAHYLSDVTFGYFIGFGTAVLVRIALKKYFAKKSISFEDEDIVLTVVEE